MNPPLGGALYSSVSFFYRNISVLQSSYVVTWQVLRQFPATRSWACVECAHFVNKTLSFPFIHQSYRHSFQSVSVSKLTRLSESNILDGLGWLLQHCTIWKHTNFSHLSCFSLKNFAALRLLLYSLWSCVTWSKCTEPYCSWEWIFYKL